MKRKFKYVDELLKQESFTLGELRDAIHRYPIRWWFRKQSFMLREALETYYFKIKLWIARL